MMRALTRRSLVAAAPAVIVTAAVPALAAENPDAALLALREPYERTLAAMDLVSKPHSAAEKAYFALKTTKPDLDASARRHASRLDSTEIVWEQAVDANHKVILEIAARPAHTTEGVIFKAKVSERESNGVPDLVASIVTDLVAMGGAHA